MEYSGYPSGLASMVPNSSTWDDLEWEEQFQKWCYGSDESDAGSAETIESLCDWELESDDFASGPITDTAGATRDRTNCGNDEQASCPISTKEDQAFKLSPEISPENANLDPSIAAMLLDEEHMSHKPIADESRFGDFHPCGTQLGSQLEKLDKINDHGPREHSTGVRPPKQQTENDILHYNSTVVSTCSISSFGTIFNAIHLLEDLNEQMTAIFDKSTSNGICGDL
ncbi:hypothetical protein HDK77DRAFT_430078 [Phyllosticta capitalensis]